MITAFLLKSATVPKNKVFDVQEQLQIFSVVLAVYYSVIVVKNILNSLTSF